MQAYLVFLAACS